MEQKTKHTPFFLLQTRPDTKYIEFPTLMSVYLSRAARQTDFRELDATKYSYRTNIPQLL